MKDQPRPHKRNYNKLPKSAHELIQTMSAAEKRYFTSQIKDVKNNKGETPDYLHLFHILNKMNEYDEKKAKKLLLKKVGKESFSNFSIKKNDLYEVLKKHLKAFHLKNAKQSADYIKVLIYDANFFFKRRMYEQSKKYLLDAKKMAEECGDTLSLIEINRFEREYMRTTRDLEIEKKIKILHEEENQLLENLKIEADCMKDYDLLVTNRFRKSRLTSEKEIEKFKKEFGYLEAKRTNDNYPILAVRFLLSSLSEYYHMIQENDLMLEVRELHYDWWKKNRLWRKQLPHNFINSLSNLLAAFHRKKDYKKFPDLLARLDAIEASNKIEEAQRFHRLINYRLVHYLNVGLIEEACHLSSLVEKGFKKYKLNEGVQVILAFNTLIGYFFNRNFKKCIYWVDFFKPYKKTEREFLVVQVAQLIEVITFYDLKQNKNFVDAYESALKYFKEDFQYTEEDFQIKVLIF
ncbi:MAG: hypothetical protein AAF573_15975, partial [Bacteroidota bacterium]